MLYVAEMFEVNIDGRDTFMGVVPISGMTLEEAEMFAEGLFITREQASMDPFAPPPSDKILFRTERDRMAIVSRDVETGLIVKYALVREATHSEILDITCLYRATSFTFATNLYLPYLNTCFHAANGTEALEKVRKAYAEELGEGFTTRVEGKETIEVWDSNRALVGKIHVGKQRGNRPGNRSVAEEL